MKKLLEITVLAFVAMIFTTMVYSEGTALKQPLEVEIKDGMVLATCVPIKELDINQVEKSRYKDVVQANNNKSEWEQLGFVIKVYDLSNNLQSPFYSIDNSINLTGLTKGNAYRVYFYYVMKHGLSVSHSTAELSSESMKFVLPEEFEYTTSYPETFKDDRVKVSLKELYDDPDKYINKMIETEGYIGKPIGGYPKYNEEIKKITLVQTFSDGSIFDKENNIDLIIKGFSGRVTENGNNYVKLFGCLFKTKSEYVNPEVLKSAKGPYYFKEIEVIDSMKR